MVETILVVIGLFVCFVIGYGIGVLLQKKKTERTIGEAETIAEKIKKEANKEEETIIKTAKLDAKDLILNAKTEFEKETKQRRNEIQRLENRLISKEENIDKKMDLLEKKESDLRGREKGLGKRENNIKNEELNIEKTKQEAKQNLERISGLTSDEAKKILIDQMVEEAKHEGAKFIKQIEDETKEVADKKSKNILALAIQRYAGEYVTERTVTVVDLPNDEMKGRIIGREGRNIRALEALTGVDLIIDDTPEAVVISGYNPVRREVARMSLEKLMTDGRIHPARIEEIVLKTTKEIDQSIKEAGEQATFDLGIHGIHPELIKLVGRLKYRTSYAQNQWQHSIEVGFLCGIMAAELGLNVKQAKRAGLLHDIGKAVDHEVEGSHAMIGADLAKRYGESIKIVHGIRAHHEDEKPDTVLAVLVQAADALSGARPGARREMLESYVKRLEELEAISKTFKGVDKTYAIQAGREVRIIVESDKVNDEDTLMLAKNVSKKIEQELTYPGQIRVTVIRETRSVEYAK